MWNKFTRAGTKSFHLTVLQLLHDLLSLGIKFLLCDKLEFTSHLNLPSRNNSTSITFKLISVKTSFFVLVIIWLNFKTLKMNHLN
jgi:hypothetical protein